MRASPSTQFVANTAAIQHLPSAADSEAGGERNGESEEGQKEIRTRKIAKRAGAGMVVVSVTAPEAAVEISSEQMLAVPPQLQQHKYQLPKRRVEGHFRLLVGHLAVVSALCGC